MRRPVSTGLAMLALLALVAAACAKDPEDPAELAAPAGLMSTSDGRLNVRSDRFEGRCRAPPSG